VGVYYCFDSDDIIVGLQVGPSRPSIVTTGWGKLKPLSPSIVYDHSSGDFTASFTNTVGTSIEITNAAVTDKLDPSVIWRDPLIDGADPTISHQIVAAGDSFKLDSIESNKVRTAGDPFDLEITITYDQVRDGIKTTQVETGYIRGPVEY
jgi:hypothetical protein